MVYGQLQPTPPQLSLAERIQAGLQKIYASQGRTAPTYPVNGYGQQPEQPGMADSFLNVAQKYAIKKALKAGIGSGTSAAVPLAPGADIGAAMLSSGATPAFAAGASGIGTGAGQIGASMLAGTTPQFGIGLGAGGGEVGGLTLGANTALDSSLGASTLGAGSTAGAGAGTTAATTAGTGAASMGGMFAGQGLAGMSTAGVLGTAALLAAPIVLGPMVKNLLYGAPKKRGFYADEIAQDKHFNAQLPQFAALGSKDKIKFLTDLRKETFLYGTDGTPRTKVSWSNPFVTRMSGDSDRKTGRLKDPTKGTTEIGSLWRAANLMKAERGQLQRDPETGAYITPPPVLDRPASFDDIYNYAKQAGWDKGVDAKVNYPNARTVGTQASNWKNLQTIKGFLDAHIPAPVTKVTPAPAPTGGKKK